MRVCLRYLVLFLRLLSVCVAKAVDLGLNYYQHGQASTLPTSALIECTPASCTTHLECSWKYCPISGHVPKCVEGQYSNRCCMCTDEWPSILSRMMSSSCSSPQPLNHKNGFYDMLHSPQRKICHQLFKNDIRSNKIMQLYKKNLNNGFKKDKSKSYLDSEIKRQHKKKLFQYQMRRKYDFLSVDDSRNDSNLTTEGGYYDYVDTNSKAQVHKRVNSSAIRNDKNEISEDDLFLNFPYHGINKNIKAMNNTPISELVTESFDSQVMYLDYKINSNVAHDRSNKSTEGNKNTQTVNSLVTESFESLVTYSDYKINNNIPSGRGNKNIEAMDKTETISSSSTENFDVQVTFLDYKMNSKLAHIRSNKNMGGVQNTQTINSLATESFESPVTYSDHKINSNIPYDRSNKNTETIDKLQTISSFATDSFDTQVTYSERYDLKRSKSEETQKINEGEEPDANIRKTNEPKVLMGDKLVG